jgi:hypothetical protein
MSTNRVSVLWYRWIFTFIGTARSLHHLAFSLLINLTYPPSSHHFPFGLAISEDTDVLLQLCSFPFTCLYNFEDLEYHPWTANFEEGPWVSNIEGTFSNTFGQCRASMGLGIKILTGSPIFVTTEINAKMPCNNKESMLSSAHNKT